MRFANVPSWTVRLHADAPSLNENTLQASTMLLEANLQFVAQVRPALYEHSAPHAQRQCLRDMRQ